MNIQFFSLFSAIKQHSLPESYLAKALKNDKHYITYVNCGGILKNFCTAMSGCGLDIDSIQSSKRRICQKCNNFSNIINKEISSNVLYLSEYMTETYINEINTIMANITKDNCIEFQYLGVEVGRLASYEPVLHHKKMTLDFDAEDWIEYRINFQNCLIALRSYEQLFTKNKPDLVIIYSPQYGVNGVVSKFIQNHNIRVYFIEGGSSNSERYKSLRIWDFKKFGLVNPALSYWKEKKDTVKEEDVKRIRGHISELLAAKSHAVYSEAPSNSFDIFNYFKIKNHQKIILASLSSFDEAYAAYVIKKFPENKVKSNVYINQFEWIKDTIKYLSNYPDIFLIIRVHPRDYSNKRDNKRSEQSYIWEEILQDLPSNIVVNYPYEKISIYDLFKDINVLLTGWSATGIEAMFYGIPVVTYDKNLPSYPNDIHFSGSNRKEYFNNIQKALKNGRNEKIITNAYKWSAFNFSLGVFRTPKLFFGDKKNIYEKIILKILNILIPNLLFKYEVKKEIKNKKDLDKLLHLVNTQEDSLYQQLN